MSYRLTTIYPQIGGLKLQDVDLGSENLGLRLEAGWSIRIANPYTPPQGGVTALLGTCLVEIITDDDTVELFFEGGQSLSVDVRDAAFSGPEAMVVVGPDNALVVWN